MQYGYLGLELGDTEMDKYYGIFCVYLTVCPLENTVVPSETRLPSRRDTACRATEDMTSVAGIVEEQQVTFCFACLPLKLL